MRRLSKDFQLASRQMALIAVVQREGDQAGSLPETHVVPVGMPEDEAFASIFPSKAGGTMDFCLSCGSLEAEVFEGTMPAGESVRKMTRSLSSEPSQPMLSRIRSLFSSDRQVDEQLETLPHEEANVLVELATLIEPDGGIPDDSLTARVQRSLLAMLCFCAEEDVRRRGIFRAHVVRLIGFIEAVDHNQLSEALQNLCDRSLMLVGQEDFKWEAWEETAKKLTSGKKLKETELERLLSSAVGEDPGASKS